MKNCLVCQWQGDPPEFACPCCGEASWGEDTEGEKAPSVKTKKAAKAEKTEKA